VSFFLFFSVRERRPPLAAVARSLALLLLHRSLTLLTVFPHLFPFSSPPFRPHSASLRRLNRPRVENREKPRSKR